MPSTPARRPQSILLLDGDLRTSQRLAMLLREDGFDVEVICDGASAMARLTHGPQPDVLVTELSLPITDGVTVARFALARRPDIRIIVVTRYPNSLDPRALHPSGAVVLPKPLDYSRLLELLAPGLAASQSGVTPASSRC